MTDIVERLRKHRHGFDRNGSHAAYRYVCLCDHDADEAADEIDRLRGLLREARDFLILLGDDCGDPRCEECARYRLRDRIDAVLAADSAATVHSHCGKPLKVANGCCVWCGYSDAETVAAVEGEK